MLFGLIVKRTDIRVFPTEEISMTTPTSYEFDRFQHSSISAGSLIGIYHFSKDRLWAYVQTGFIRGWYVRLLLLLLRIKKEAVHYEDAKERLFITGSFVKVFGDPSLHQFIFLAQMGNTFPILNPPSNNGITLSCYMIQIPFREVDGALTFRKGYLSKDEDVHLGFLSYTRKIWHVKPLKCFINLMAGGDVRCQGLFSFHHGYLRHFRDSHASQFKTSGKDRNQSWTDRGNDYQEKERVLDRAIPMATTLRLPGHIMLYLGKDKGNYYAIHNIWAIQKRGWFKPVLEKIGKVVVSDLSLGRSGPYQSLLHRVTDIQNDCIRFRSQK